MNVRDLDQQWATQLSNEYPRWRAITGSGDNFAICPNFMVVSNPKQACA